MTSSSIRRYWGTIAGAAVVLVSQLLSLPRTPWDAGEFGLAAGVRNLDPLALHPPPPGNPLFIGLGKLASIVTGDPFTALVAINVLASVLGFVVLSIVFRRLLGDPVAAAAGALIFYLSAGMLVFTPLALEDGATILFVVLTFAALSGPPDDRHALAAGLFCAAAIGCLPQLILPLLPAFVLGLWVLRTWRLRALAAFSFGFGLLIFFLPLAEAAGGLRKLMKYWRGQETYFAGDEIATGARSAKEFFLAFIAHPWGPKLITIPLAILVVVGARAFYRRVEWRDAPLIIFCALHLALGFFIGDPANGVRYALPAMMLIALIAACSFLVIGRTPAAWIAAAFLAGASWWYVRPIVGVRHSTPSPIAAAAAHVNTTFPPDTVLLYDSLRPQIEYLMPRFQELPFEVGFARMVDQSAPLVAIEPGRSRSPDAAVFQWPDSDAYRKLTRGDNREVTVDPIPSSERYLPLRGIYPLERTLDGDEWRWLARSAALRLPLRHGLSAALTFRLSHDAPFEQNRLRISVNRVQAADVVVRKGSTAPVTLALPADPDVIVEIEAADVFLPATVLRNGDRRSLAVQLIGVVSSP